MWKWMLMLAITLSTYANAEITVLAFSGSTQENSVNKKLIKEAATIAKEAGAEVTLVDLKDYAAPFYDGDLEIKDGLPAKAKELRQLMIQNSIILIASPEYNGSVSAILKNALDWASRSEEKAPSRDAFKGKTFILMSASPSPSGGARGLAHLKAIIENVGGTVSQEFVLPNAYAAFDEQGHLTSAQLKEKLKQVIETIKK